MNKGHVTFFYNKGQYIHMRFTRIKAELLKRGFNLTVGKMVINDDIFHENSFYHDWQPSTQDIKLVAERIKQRILEKPELYRDKERFLDYCQTELGV